MNTRPQNRPKVKGVRRPCILASSSAALMALWLEPQPAHAQTWLGTADTLWNNTANWNPAVIPNSSGATAIFDAAANTSILLNQAEQVGAITFTSNAASSYDISLNPGTPLTISGAGITNNSGVVQDFSLSADGSDNNASITFANSATAGSNVTFFNFGAPGNSPAASSIIFSDTSTAGSATIDNDAGTVAGGPGGATLFTTTSASAIPTAGNATITNAGATISGALGGSTTFSNGSAGNATILTQRGSNGGGGGATIFTGFATGGTASATTDGNGVFDVSQVTSSMSIGSIAGSGRYFLGSNTLTVGGNNNTTEVSGVIADGGIGGGTGGSLVKTGAGTLTLSGLNTYSGSTTITGGTLQLGGTTSGAINPASAVNVGSNATLTLFAVAGNTFANDIVGEDNSTINVTSASPLLISGNISSAVNGLGVEKINLNVSGYAILANSNFEFFGPITITNGGSLQLGTSTSAGLSSAGGAVSVNSGGKLTLVNINDGVFFSSVTNGVAGASAGIVEVNSASDVDLTGNFSNGAAGQLTLHQIGTGTTTLSGTNTYTGQTLVTSGGLEVDGTIGAGSAVSVTGGALNGSGQIQGSVNLLGGFLAAGSLGFAGTLGVGSLNLSSGTTSLRLGQNVTDDLINVTGNLALGGNLNIIPQQGFSVGTYTLFTYSGSLSQNAGGFARITGIPGYNASVVTGTNGQVQLVVSYLGTAQYWDGGGAPNDGVISSGSGNWNSSSANWTDSSGASNSKWSGGTAIVQGSATVTLTSGVSAQAIFIEGSALFSGSSTLTMTGSSPSINVTNLGGGASIMVPVAGTAGFIAGGPGRVSLLSSANSYTGGTTVVGGTLQIGFPGLPGSLGAGNVSIQNGGTLALYNLKATSLTSNITNGVAGLGILATQSLENFTLSGTLTDGAAGQLALDISEGGPVILTNPHTDKSLG